MRHRKPAAFHRSGSTGLGRPGRGVGHLEELQPELRIPALPRLLLPEHPQKDSRARRENRGGPCLNHSSAETQTQLPSAQDLEHLRTNHVPRLQVESLPSRPGQNENRVFGSNPLGIHDLEGIEFPVSVVVSSCRYQQRADGSRPSMHPVSRCRAWGRGREGMLCVRPRIPRRSAIRCRDRDTG